MHWKFLRRKMRFQFSKNDMVAMVGSVKLAGYSKRHLHSEYFFCLTWPSEWWWGHKYTQRPYRKRKTTTYTTKTQMLFFPAIWVSLRIWHYNHPFHSRPNFTASILRRFVYLQFEFSRAKNRCFLEQTKSIDDVILLISMLFRYETLLV